MIANSRIVRKTTMETHRGFLRRNLKINGKILVMVILAVSL